MDWPCSGRSSERPIGARIIEKTLGDAGEREINLLAPSPIFFGDQNLQVKTAGQPAIDGGEDQLRSVGRMLIGRECFRSGTRHLWEIPNLDGVSNLIEYALRQSKWWRGISASRGRYLRADARFQGCGPPPRFERHRRLHQRLRPVGSSPDQSSGAHRRFTIPVTPGEKCFIRLRVSQSAL